MLNCRVLNNSLVEFVLRMWPVVWEPMILILMQVVHRSSFFKENLFICKVECHVTSRDIFHPMVLIPKGCNSQCWARREQKPGTLSESVSCLSGPHEIWPLSAFPGTLARISSRAAKLKLGLQYGMLACKWCSSPLHHNTSYGL